MSGKTGATLLMYIYGVHDGVLLVELLLSIKKRLNGIGLMWRHTGHNGVLRGGGAVCEISGITN